jgi:hypothetical protein
MGFKDDSGILEILKAELDFLEVGGYGRLGNQSQPFWVLRLA